MSLGGIRVTWLLISVGVIVLGFIIVLVNMCLFGKFLSMGLHIVGIGIMFIGKIILLSVAILAAIYYSGGEDYVGLFS